MNRRTHTRRLVAALAPPALMLAALLVVSRPSHALGEPRVELVFVEPGDAVWTRFGHIALRVVDSDPEAERDPTTEGTEGTDVLFNYGYAPFDQPDFLWRYLRGEAEFELAVKRWDWSLTRYRRWDRTVRRYELRLPAPMLRDLLFRLQENARPENAGYRYDHLRDNCSTRVRDLLDDVTGGALRAGVGQDPEQPPTYRDFTLEAGSGRLLVQIIFDLIGGPNQERPVDPYAALYLPRFVEEAAVAATIAWDGGGARPLVGPPIVEYERRGPPPTTSNRGAGRRAVTTGALALGALLVLGGLTGRRLGAAAAWLTRLAGLALAASALVMGLIGAALLGLVIVSRVPDFVWNDNVLVFWPSDLIWLVSGVRWLVSGRPRLGRIERIYTGVRLVALAAYGIAKVAGLFPQDNWAFLAAASAVVVALFVTGRQRATAPAGAEARLAS